MFIVNIVMFARRILLLFEDVNTVKPVLFYDQIDSL